MEKVYVALNAGNGVVVAVCEVETKAIAFAKAGTNRVVREFEILEQLNGEGKLARYIPIKACNVIPATPEDRAAQDLLDNQRSALAKAKAAGMTKAEILAILALDQDEIK